MAANLANRVLGFFGLSEETKPVTAREGDRLPTHIAIVMDGNGRWARRKGLPRSAGHRAGVEAVRRIVRAAGDIGIGYLTLYAFSSENWSRPDEEVSDLMALMRRYLREEIDELAQNGVRVRFIGDRSRLDADLATMMSDAESRTKDNKAMTLVVGINYGGQHEIARAAQALARDVAAGALTPDDIDEARFAGYLDTFDLPEPDLLIRTSGEKRLSNFLLWQAAYSEFVFVDTLWPDFGPEALLDAIAEFNSRDRRFGGRK